jgi:hypothetical protein
MLICSVSVRPPRRAIAAAIAETAAAVDALGTGNVVFATLVDDPASVAELVDAYLGEIMLEAASAADVVESGLAYLGEIAEAATALSVEDGTTTSPPAFTTWNPSDKSGINLTGGDLTATSAVGGGAGVRAISSYSSGKRYFEITTTTLSSGYVGLALSSAVLSAGTTTNAIGLNAGGSVWLNNSLQGSWSLPGLGGGAILGIAIDLTNTLIWFRVGASGSWNALSGTANNPATGTGGINYSTIAGALFPWFSSAFTNGQVVTANFGATAFNGTVPSGFASGW